MESVAVYTEQEIKFITRNGQQTITAMAGWKDAIGSDKSTNKKIRNYINMQFY